MKPYSIIRLYGVVFPFVLLSPHYGAAQAAAITRFPADRAVGVNPDTHLVLTFATAPTLGKSGQIRIYDAAGHQLVDTLDLSIPAGPDPSRRITAPAPADPARRFHSNIAYNNDPGRPNNPSRPA